MYSAEIKRHLMSPTNGRRHPHYNGTGYCETLVRCRTNPDRVIKTRSRFMVLIDGGVVRDARWEVFGDPVALAVSSWCVEHMLGKQVADLVHIITPENAALDLNITRELDIRGGCRAVIDSVVRAFNDYETSSLDSSTH